MDKNINEAQIAMELLRGKGLNRASFARVILDKENVAPKDKDATRECFDNTLEQMKEKFGDMIFKDGHDYFIKEADVEALQAQVADLKNKNAVLRDEIAKLTRGVQEVKERKQWLYKNGKGEMFYISEVQGKLKEGWKDHPKNS